jgi:hypothetical protein
MSRTAYLERLMELAEEALYEAELEAMSKPRPRWPVHSGDRGAGDPFLHALIAIRAKILDALNARPPEVNLLIDQAIEIIETVSRRYRGRVTIPPELENTRLALRAAKNLVPQKRREQLSIALRDSEMAVENRRIALGGLV